MTEAEHAHNHCQVGNMGLALDVMTTWLAEKEGAPEREMAGKG